MGNTIAVAEGAAAPPPEEQASPEKSDEVLDSGDDAGKGEAGDKPADEGEPESKEGAEESDGNDGGDGGEGGDGAEGEEGGQEEGEGGGEQAEEGGEGEEEEEEEQPRVTVDDVKTAPLDVRFPTVNQAKHCYTRYNEFHRCAANKGEDAPECAKYQRYYRAICPGDWVDKWNEERDMGTFVGRY